MMRNLLAVFAGSMLLAMSARQAYRSIPCHCHCRRWWYFALASCSGHAWVPPLFWSTWPRAQSVCRCSPALLRKEIGLAYMMGPTGGYLAGFVVAAFVTGLLAQRGWDRRVSTTVAAMLLGNAVIYACGLIWLGTVVGWDKPVLAWGLTPFLLGDLVKILVAAAALPAIWKFLKND